MKEECNVDWNSQNSHAMAGLHPRSTAGESNREQKDVTPALSKIGLLYAYTVLHCIFQGKESK